MRNIAQLDESLLAAEAYDENYQKLGLYLEWGEPQPENVRLQNYPNPFSTGTTIRFEAAEAGRARLEVFHLDGTLVKAIEEFYAEGPHEVAIHSNDLPAPGVYLYKLQLNGKAWVRKMVYSGG